MEPGARQALHALLVTLWSPMTAERFILDHHLRLRPNFNFSKSLAQIVDDIITMLEQHGLIKADFFRILIEEYPARSGEIEQRASACGFPAVQADEQDRALGVLLQDLFATDGFQGFCTFIREEYSSALANQLHSSAQDPFPHAVVKLREQLLLEKPFYNRLVTKFPAHADTIQRVVGRLQDRERATRDQIRLARWLEEVGFLQAPEMSDGQRTAASTVRRLLQGLVPGDDQRKQLYTFLSENYRSKKPPTPEQQAQVQGVLGMVVGLYTSTGVLIGAGVHAGNNRILTTRSVLDEPALSDTIPTYRALDGRSGTLSEPMLHPCWDVAVLEMDSQGDGIALPFAAPLNMVGRPVYALLPVQTGWRYCAGTLGPIAEVEGSERYRVQAVTHDCASGDLLPGTPIFDGETHTLLAIHAGRRPYGVSYATPTWELARDQRLGLQIKDSTETPTWTALPMVSPEVDTISTLIPPEARVWPVRSGGALELPAPWSVGIRSLAEAIQVTGYVQAATGWHVQCTGFLIAPGKVLLVQQFMQNFFSSDETSDGNWVDLPGATFDLCVEEGAVRAPLSLNQVRHFMSRDPLIVGALAQVDPHLSLRLAAKMPDRLQGRPVATIGHPVPDSRRRGRISDANGLKRISIGRLRGIESSRFSKGSSVLYHDCVTQVGSAGGPLIDIETGVVLGVQFAWGSRGSYAIPVWELQARAELETMGVQFVSI